jgi:hypothetical protein
MNSLSGPALEERENSVFAEWTKASPEIAHTFWKDGVATASAYRSASLPTLLLSKRPNARGALSGNWDMRRGIRDGVRRGN